MPDPTAADDTNFTDFMLHKNTAASGKINFADFSPLSNNKLPIP
jgi:predicted RNA binding protein with dsRBD fold (UPF0201 family)